MCGIAAYNGNNFNKDKFNILGIFNDSRGGDSCGVFINNKDGLQLSYGHGKTELYRDFITSGVNLDFDETTIALCHCRKASVGGIGEAQAQPVSIFEKNEAGEDELVFVMIHNGTLTNYKELANKYDVNFKVGETDSQIFAKIVYKQGYDVLGEYEGAGAFIFWDSRDGDNTIKVFKGASLFYMNTDKIFEERPLFMLQNGDESVWFSSMENSLKFIQEKDYVISNVKCNLLYTIFNGKIISEIPIDRSKRKSTSTLVYSKEYPYQNNNHNNNSFNRNAYGYYGNYEDWDCWDEDRWNNSWDEKNKQKAIPFKAGSDLRTLINVIYLYEPKKLTWEPKDKIYFDVDGLYKINNQICHGEYNATIAGYLDKTAPTYYFMCGVMMKSYFDYLCAGEYILEMFGDDVDQSDVYPYYLAKWSTTPVPVDFDEDGKDSQVSFHCYDEQSIQSDKTVEFDGKFAPYFCFQIDEYEVNDGWMIKCTSYSEKNVYEMTEVQKELDKKILDLTISNADLMQMIQEEIKCL